MIRLMTDAPFTFDEAARQGLYHAIFTRRDVRAQFKPDPVPDEILARLLMAAHHAPSVGYMQPWSFLLVQDAALRNRVKALFDQANAEARAMFDDEKGAAYARLKLEGIVESPVNLCVTCDPDRAGKVVIGRTHIPVMDEYSTVCAVMNLWLAARAEGLGVGWVSILDPEALKETLGIPERVVPVAYLCIGYVTHFLDKPELELAGWRQRLPLESLVHQDRWGNDAPVDLTPFLKAEPDGH
ncbi:5,6-dimethylbenzimidazole synthase [Rhodospirillaceae bacterium LM-1]|nr:5,6-dimethylbenzimidazole synthase [Rhodospirillaceae bacterium LM-1]